MIYCFVNIMQGLNMLVNSNVNDPSFLIYHLRLLMRLEEEVDVYDIQKGKMSKKQIAKLVNFICDFLGIDSIAIKWIVNAEKTTSEYCLQPRNERLEKSMNDTLEEYAKNGRKAKGFYFAELRGKKYVETIWLFKSYLCSSDFDSRADLLETIAHECRHAWQRQHEPEMFKSSDSDVYSAAEVDAEAFSLLFLLFFLNINYTDLYDTRLESIVKARCEEIQDDFVKRCDLLLTQSNS